MKNREQALLPIRIFPSHTATRYCALWSGGTLSGLEPCLSIITALMSGTSFPQRANNATSALSSFFTVRTKMKGGA